MKILTLNTHSLQEENYEEKLGFFLEFILREQPDLIALQEVNQSASASVAHDCHGMVQLPGIEIPLKEDNHALRIARHLESEGIPVSWVYLPIKLGYGKYDEGVAVMYLNGRITATDVSTISSVNDYQNWRTRKVLGVQVDNRPEWFYTVHMGWWQDEHEPFERQWSVLQEHLAQKQKHDRVWLMGDFNSPAEVRGQGYDLVAESGWQDTYLLAEEKDAGFTVRGVIDGWRELLKDEIDPEGMRIDHIWCSEMVDVEWCSVVFNGEHEPVVSDHFGVLLETKGET